MVVGVEQRVRGSEGNGSGSRNYRCTGLVKL
jgi:hypothetical protein